MELGFESVLRHRVKVQIKGHFGRVPEWPTFLPHPIIARYRASLFLQSLEDDVQPAAMARSRSLAACW